LAKLYTSDKAHLTTKTAKEMTAMQAKGIVAFYAELTILYTVQ
jgi:hypothetical protein